MGTQKLPCLRSMQSGCLPLMVTSTKCLKQICKKQVNTGLWNEVQVQFPSKLHWSELALCLDVKCLFPVSLVLPVLTVHGVLEALTLHFSY